MTSAAEINQLFLESVAPQDGNLMASVGLRNPRWFDYRNQKERESFLRRHAESNIYYSPASYTGTHRVESEVLHCQVLFLDIDAGEVKYAKHGDKVYKTYDDALRDMDDWINESAREVPYPSWVVRSGEGLHYYWLLNQPLTLDQWKPLQRGLLRRAYDEEVRIDNSVSSMNEFLRMPGSVHLNSGNVVEILADRSNQVAYDYLDLCKAFPPRNGTEKAVATADPLGLGARPDTLSVLDDVETTGVDALVNHRKRNFASILNRATQGSGCNFLREAYEQQATCAYADWRAALSIAANCEDGAEMIHQLGHKHPQYNYTDTEKMAAGTEGRPYTCDKIEDLRPDLCANCSLRGKIKSPIMSGGNIIPTVTPEEHRQNLITERMAIIPQATNPFARALRHITVRTKQLEVLPPVMDDSYGLSPKGWVVRYGHGGADDYLLYHYPVYLTARYKSDTNGDDLTLVYESPSDGVRKLLFRQRDLASPVDVSKMLMDIGIILTNKKGREEMHTYLCKSAQKLQETRGRITSDNFGWQTGTELFIHGQHAFSREGIEYEKEDGTKGNEHLHAAAVRNGHALTMAMTPSDEADPKVWGDFVQRMMIPGMEPVIMAIGLSLGAPLFRMSNTVSGLTHFYSLETGRGKTTALRTALSVWGRGTSTMYGSGLMAFNTDTELALYHRMAVHGSIPVGIDEVTDRPADELQQLIYRITQGRERDRLEGSTNALRENARSWDMPVLSSGNTSIKDALSAQGDTRSALMARCIELDCAGIPALPGGPNEVENTLRNIEEKHAGVVGRAISYYVAVYQNVIKDMLRENEKLLSQRYTFEKGERFWSAMLLCCLTGLEMAQAMHLISFDKSNMLRYFDEVMFQSRNQQTRVAHNPLDMLHDFLSAHTLGQVYLQRRTDALPMMEIPRQPVSLYIVEESELSISLPDLRLWAKSQNKGVKMLEDYILHHGGSRQRVDLLPGNKTKDVRKLCLTIPHYKMSAAPDTSRPTSEEQSYMDQMR